jgi:hypothetical protein
MPTYVHKHRKCTETPKDLHDKSWQNPYIRESHPTTISYWTLKQRLGNLITERPPHNPRTKIRVDPFNASIKTTGSETKPETRTHCTQEQTLDLAASCPIQILTSYREPLDPTQDQLQPCRRSRKPNSYSTDTQRQRTSKKRRNLMGHNITVI